MTHLLQWLQILVPPTWRYSTTVTAEKVRLNFSLIDWPTKASLDLSLKDKSCYIGVYATDFDGQQKLLSVRESSGLRNHLKSIQEALKLLIQNQ